MLRDGSIQISGEAPTLPWVGSRFRAGVGLGLSLREGWVDTSPEYWLYPMSFIYQCRCATLWAPSPCRTRSRSFWVRVGWVERPQNAGYIRDSNANLLPSVLAVVSPVPLPDNYISLRITNMAGTPATLIPGDNQPASGFAIKANVIAQITKTVPAIQPIQFQVVDSNTGKPLFLNSSQFVNIMPTKTKGTPASLVIVKGGKKNRYQPNSSYCVM